MTLDARHYRDMMVRAVLGTEPAMLSQAADPALIDLLATFLAQAEEAKQILRAKGYGVTGTAIHVTARLVPDNDT